MNTFHELVIHLTSVSVLEFVARLERHLPAGWKRDVEWEDRLRALSPGCRGQFCFVCQDHPKVSPASVWLVEQGPNCLAVANIISEKKGELTKSEYNRLLANFQEHIVVPAAAEGGARLNNSSFTSFRERPSIPPTAESGTRREASSAHGVLEANLPEEVIDRLRQFSAAANKAAGSLHPQDQRRWLQFIPAAHKRRWLQFIAAAHKRRCSPSPEVLARWLAEEEHWPADIASRLVEEYEFGLELLSVYDSQAD